MVTFMVAIGSNSEIPCSACHKWDTKAKKFSCKPLPLAVAGVSRETEFGLAFYRNQIIDRYESGQVPAGEHLVVAPEGSQTAIAKQVAGRRVVYLGSFAPQGLDYCLLGWRRSGWGR